MSCKRAQGFLEANDYEVVDVVDATRERRGKEAALALARTVNKIVVSKGKKVVVFDMKSDPPDDEILSKYLLGPTGNLRAPTLRQGKTLFVGFQEDLYRQTFGQ